MKHVPAIVLMGTLAAAATSYGQAGAPTPANPTDQKPDSKMEPKGTAGMPAPIAVEVVAVDPDAKTITVREITAVPAPPGKAVEVKLPVPASATGDKLDDVKAGQKVDVTCAVKPTVHPTAGVPVVLTDCVRVIKIDAKPKQ